MQKISTIVLSEELSTSEVLKLFVSEFDMLELQPQTNDYSAIYENITNYSKSLLIVDLSTNKQAKLDLILKVSQDCKNCKVLALSDNPSVDLIIEIMRSGAKDFVPIPIIKNEFCSVLNKIISENNEKKSKNKCKIISIFSNKGGIGKMPAGTFAAAKQGICNANSCV